MSTRTAALLCMLLLAGLALAQGTDQDVWDESALSTPKPTVAIEPALLEGWQNLPGWQGMRCASCHSEVAQEWASSAHGLSWVDVDYSASMRGKRRPKSCHACHIPQPLLSSGSLTKRVRPRDSEADEAHFGVTCATCHLGPDGVVLGPWGISVDAHESLRSADHLKPEDSGTDDPGTGEPGTGGDSNALCSACHSTDIGPVIGIAKDFKRAGMAARGLSCVGCHMAPVERRWANSPGEAEAGGAKVPLRPGRSHALQTPRDPAFLRLAFDWALGEGGQDGLLILRNRAGHRVPGVVGRILTFTVTGLSADGEVLGSESFVLDSSSYLPVDGLREIALASGSVAALVVGEHKDPRADSPHEFLRLRVK